MKICLLGLVLWSTVALASSRIYDVAPWRNDNGWANGDQYHGICETFLSDVDSSLTWAEAFIGASNSGGTYTMEIWDGNTKLYSGGAFAGDSVHYQFRRAQLTRLSDEPIVRGKEYTLKVYHSGGEALNFYYDPDPATRYRWGHITQPTGLPDTWCLAARIEGENKAVSPFFWGTHTRQYTFATWRAYDSARKLAALAHDAGAKTARLPVEWYYVETAPGVFDWARSRVGQDERP